jgi:hypothetical protein
MMRLSRAITFGVFPNPNCMNCIVSAIAVHGNLRYYRRPPAQDIADADNHGQHPQVRCQSHSLAFELMMNCC